MRVLVTGISGQDGSYLAEALVGRGDDVHGVSRRPADPHPNLAAVRDRVRLHAVDLADARATSDLLRRLEPDCVFHLAAQSFIGAAEADGMGFNVSSTMTLLEGLHRHTPGARFLLAGSAAQLAGASVSPQSEATPRAPLSVYGLSKQLASEAVAFFRERRGLRAATAILYNHESPRRPPEFLSRKLVRAAVRISRGLEQTVDVGDLDARRDWGWAPEYADAMIRMVELDTPEDLVLATGVPHSVQEMAEAAFAAVGLEAGPHLVVRDELRRGKEPILLVGDPRRAGAVLGWEARTPFHEVIRRMVQAELAATGG